MLSQWMYIHLPNFTRWRYISETVGDSFLGTYLTDILIWYNYKWIGSALRPSFVDQDINAVSGFWLMCGR